jgi:hypothetical protein
LKGLYGPAGPAFHRQDTTPAADTSVAAFFLVCHSGTWPICFLCGRKNMPIKEFLEQWPLYKKFPSPNFNCSLGHLPKPAINMVCPICKSNQTYIMTNNYYDRKGLAPAKNATGLVLFIKYHCAHSCGHERCFMVSVDPTGENLVKVGQSPPWEIEMNKDLSKSLGGYDDYFKKALVCESQGYGIGAFSYYRRVVEGLIDKLLDEISSLLADDELEKFQSALAKTKSEKMAKDKIALVKDLLPPQLRPDDVNPLATLHDALSHGLHNQSDEDCLDFAKDCKVSLQFLVTQILTSKRAAAGFTEGMRRLLKRKGKLNKK